MEIYDNIVKNNVYTDDDDNDYYGENNDCNDCIETADVDNDDIKNGHHEFEKKSTNNNSDDDDDDDGDDDKNSDNDNSDQNGRNKNVSDSNETIFGDKNYTAKMFGASSGSGGSSGTEHGGSSENEFVCRRRNSKTPSNCYGRSRIKRHNQRCCVTRSEIYALVREVINKRKHLGLVDGVCDHLSDKGFVEQIKYIRENLNQAFISVSDNREQRKRLSNHVQRLNNIFHLNHCLNKEYSHSISKYGGKLNVIVGNRRKIRKQPN